MATVPMATLGTSRAFVTALLVWSGLVAAASLLVALPLGPDQRVTTSAVSLLVSGVIATGCGVRRAVISPRGLATPWALLSAAGVVVITGNVWTAVVDTDPIATPNLFSDISIAVGLTLSVLGLLSFTRGAGRTTRLSVMVLDGVVAGGALLLIASVLVYPQLLGASSRPTALGQWLSVAFPILDVTAATVAILLVAGASRSDRTLYGLVGLGYVAYAASDLVYAAQIAQGTFAFGSPVDLGWVIGYLTLGLATWLPSTTSDGRTGSRRPASSGLFDVLGSALVFAVVVSAAVTQVFFGPERGLAGPQSLLWVVVITAAAARQVLLIRDNRDLRRGLERRVAEQTEDLRRLVRQNEALLTSVADGVYGVDETGCVTFVNPSGASLLGYAIDDLEGRPAHATFHAPGLDGQPYPWTGCYVHEAISAGVSSRSEYDDYVRADGTRIPVEITASPLVEGDARGAVVVFRDITQRREVERMKDEFLAVVSHELRTPLTSIRGSLSLLSSGHLGPIPSEADVLVSVAAQSTERLVRLINDLLDLERLEAGTAPSDLGTVDLGSTIRAAAHQIEGLARSAGVRIEVDPRATGTIWGLEDRLMQLLTNLVGNAIKFSPTGSAITLNSTAVDGGGVHLTVADRGRGIPADKLVTIFDRFQQVDSSDSRLHGGAGLGLSISKAIVEQHGGDIWMESTEGQGTTAHVTLGLGRQSRD